MYRTCSRPECTGKHVARGYCSTHYNLLIMGDRRHRKAETPCVVCQTPVTRRVESKYQATCSPECRQMVQWGAPAANGYDWTTDAAARARKSGVTVVDQIDRMAVFDRDEWRCYLCDQAVTLEGDCYQDLSATIDHVIPMSRGGQHTLSNVATCCFLCNSTKQASLSVA